jgi:hypothetical protein
MARKISWTRSICELGSRSAGRPAIKSAWPCPVKVRRAPRVRCAPVTVRRQAQGPWCGLSQRQEASRAVDGGGGEVQFPAHPCPQPLHGFIVTPGLIRVGAEFVQLLDWLDRITGEYIKFPEVGRHSPRVESCSRLTSVDPRQMLQPLLKLMGCFPQRPVIRPPIRSPLILLFCYPSPLPGLVVTTIGPPLRDKHAAESPEHGYATGGQR